MRYGSGLLACLFALAPAMASAATLEASYLFQNTLASGVSGAPALVATDPLSQNGFITDTVMGNSRTVYHVGGSALPATDQGGLTFDGSGLLTANSYSVAMTIEFLDRNGAWRRILDVQDRTSDDGFYVNPGNNLEVYGASGSNVGFTNDVYRNLVLTVGPGSGGVSTLTAYIDGLSSFSVNTNVMNLGLDSLIGVFLDNTAGGGQGEWSSANIAALSFYDGVLTADEAAAINGDPLAPPPSSVPEPASWAMMVAGFGLIGGALRRRRVSIRFA